MSFLVCAMQLYGSWFSHTDTIHISQKNRKWTNDFYQCLINERKIGTLEDFNQSKKKKQMNV